MNVYPTISGYVWTPTITPVWNAQLQKTVTGRVVAATYQQYPLYKFTVQYATLAQADFNTLLGFFNQQQGNVIPFLFDAGPGNDSVTAQAIGTGDGTTTAFTLLRSYAGFAEPVSAPFNYSVFTAGFGGPGYENRLTYSQSFENAAWAKYASSITTAATTAPDSTTTGESLIESATNAEHYIEQSTALGGGNHYTLSVYVKANQRSQVFLQIYRSVSDFATAVLDVSTQAVVSVGASGQPVPTAGVQTIGSGWYRVWMYCQTPSASGYSYVLGLAKSGSTSYLGDGTSGLYIWGAQAENSSAPSGYLATTSATFTWSVTGNTVTFSYAPPSGAAITWTGSYYFQCRFSKGTADFDQFMYQLYKTKSVSMETYW